MQGVTLLVAEVVTFIIRDEVDDRPVRQSRRLVKHDAPVLDACSKGAHVATIRASAMPRNHE